MEDEFKRGDRVRIRKDKIDGYLQPWRGRFEKGRCGTVVGMIAARDPWPNIIVQWDFSGRGYAMNFRFAVRASDIEMVPT